MPSNVPRSNSTKKREQLERRQLELAHAIRSGFSHERLVQAAENLRAAQLSLLKAELHWVEDSKIRGKLTGEHIARIQSDARTWTEKSVEQILHDFAA